MECGKFYAIRSPLDPLAQVTCLLSFGLHAVPLVSEEGASLCFTLLLARINSRTSLELFSQLSLPFWRDHEVTIFNVAW